MLPISFLPTGEEGELSSSILSTWHLSREENWRGFHTGRWMTLKSLRQQCSPRLCVEQTHHINRAQKMAKRGPKAYKFKGEKYSSKPCWRDQINWQARTTVWSLIAWGFLCHRLLSFLTAYSWTDSFAFWGSVLKDFTLFLDGNKWKFMEFDYKCCLLFTIDLCLHQTGLTVFYWITRCQVNARGYDLNTFLLSLSFLLIPSSFCGTDAKISSAASHFSLCFEEMLKSYFLPCPGWGIRHK